MKRGAVINLITGVLVAALPLYFRVGPTPVGLTLPFNNIETQENLLFMFFAICVAIFPRRQDTAPWYFTARPFYFLASGYFLLSALINQYHPYAWETFLHVSWVFVTVPWVFLYSQSADLKTQRYVLNGLAIGCLLQVLFVFAEQFGLYYRHFLEYYYSGGRAIVLQAARRPAIGTMASQVAVGAYISLSSMALLRQRWCFGLPFVALALYFVDSHMAYFSFLGGLCYFLWEKRFYRPLLPYFIATAAFFVGIQAGIVGLYENGRFQAWAKMLEHFPWSFKSVLFGMGPAWFSFTFPSVYQVTYAVQGQALPAVFRQEHNEFLSLFFAYGLVGAILGLCAILKAAQGRARGPWKALLFSAFVSFFGHFTAHQASTAFIFFLGLVFCFASKEGGDGQALARA